MKSVLLTLLFLAVGVMSTPAQLFNTSLTITVRDELGNTVEGVLIS